MGLAFLDRWLSRSRQAALNSTPGQLAAEREDAESQFKLAQHFGAGEGTDLARAAEWLQKAAGQGHCVAQFNLGLIYGQGKGVLRNEAAAMMWLRRAAESGHTGAQYHAGVRLHCASKAGPPLEASESRVEAFKWLRLAVAGTYRGAESALEFVTLEMTREEVNEGNRRVGAFAGGRTKS